MNKEFLPYELSLKLKKVGFDEPCFGYYDHQIKELDTISSEVCERLCKHDTHIKAPTFSQAFRWFRENHKLYSAVIPYNPKKDYYECVVCGIEEEDEDDDWEVPDTYGYFEAELSCLNKLIEIVEQKSK